MDYREDLQRTEAISCRFSNKRVSKQQPRSLGSRYLVNIDALRGRFVFVGYWHHHMSII